MQELNIQVLALQTQLAQLQKHVQPNKDPKLSDSASPAAPLIFSRASIHESSALAAATSNPEKHKVPSHSS
ncbi:MAG: hypothetical protein ACKOAD_05480 [Gammaproteobacteria bacterium]